MVEIEFIGYFRNNNKSSAGYQKLNFWKLKFEKS